jgi:hypothetical protein
LANSLDQSQHLLAESFTNGYAHKTEGVSANETSKFKCTIIENAKVRTHKFREIITLNLWPFSKDHKFIAEIQGKQKFRRHKIKVSL